VLVLDDGTSLYDSHVIVEYLDSIGPEAKRLIPASGPDRFRVLRREALCDGILEAAILVFYERQSRPKELHWNDWLLGQTQKALQGLDALDQEAASFGRNVDLGLISAGVTLGWLEFRGVLGDLRPKRQRLFDWYDVFRQRPSMLATVPKG
jgi:glutathione S-transferase